MLVYCSVGDVNYNNIALMNMAAALTIDLFCVRKSIGGGTMGAPPKFWQLLRLLPSVLIQVLYKAQNYRNLFNFSGNNWQFNCC